MGVAESIAEAINTTATRRFDVLEMKLPKDEWAQLYQELLLKQFSRYTPVDPAAPLEPLRPVISIQTQWGRVDCAQEDEPASGD